MFNKIPAISEREYANRSLSSGDGSGASGLSIKGRYMLMNDGTMREVHEVFNAAGYETDSPQDAHSFNFLRADGSIGALKVGPFRKVGGLIDWETLH